MANFKIMRNGLNTEIVGDPHIGQSSEDVTVEVTDDGTYQEYDKKLYYSYGYRNQIYRAIADENSSDEFVIPMTAFLEPGIVKLSLELSNGTNKPTCNACFISVTEGAKSVAASDILPDDATWEQYVASYVKSHADTLKGEKGDKGDTGEKGEDAVSISSIEKKSTSGLTDTYEITLTDGSKKAFNVSNGKGIKSIAKTSTSGLTDTYTITYNDGTTSKFTVKNGEKGDAGASVTVDAELSSTSTNPVQNKVIKAELDKKAYATDLGVKKVIHTASDTNVTINSGEYHVFPTMSSLTITPGNVGTDKMFICGFEFTSGSTPTVLTLTGCTLSNSDDVTAGTYEVNILGNSAIVRLR